MVSLAIRWLTIGLSQHSNVITGNGLGSPWPNHIDIHRYQPCSHHQNSGSCAEPFFTPQSLTNCLRGRISQINLTWRVLPLSDGCIRRSLLLVSKIRVSRPRYNRDFHELQFFQRSTTRTIPENDRCDAASGATPAFLRELHSRWLQHHFNGITTGPRRSQSLWSAVCAVAWTAPPTGQTSSSCASSGP